MGVELTAKIHKGAIWADEIYISIQVVITWVYTFPKKVKLHT